MRLRPIRHSYLLTAFSIGAAFWGMVSVALGLPAWLALLLVIPSGILAELAWLKFSDWFFPWLKAGEREPRPDE